MSQSSNFQELRDLYGYDDSKPDYEFAKFIERQVPGILNSFDSQFIDSLYTESQGGATISGTPTSSFIVENETGGLSGQGKSMLVDMQNWITNVGPTAASTPITLLTNPKNTIISLEQQINKRKEWLNDPLIPEGPEYKNPYEQLDSYDKSTGLPETYIETATGRRVSPQDYFMAELQEAGHGRLMQGGPAPQTELDRMNDIGYDGMSLSGMIPKDKGEIRKSIQALTQELDAAKKLYAEPDYGREKVLNHIYTTVADWQAQNLIDIKDNERNWAKNNPDLQRYYSWQENAPFEFKWGKDTHTSGFEEFTGIDLPWSTNVMHPGIARREFFNLASTMAQIWSPRGAVTTLSLLNKLRKGGKVISQSNKWLSKLDMLSMAALEGGHQYQEVYNMAVLPKDAGGLGLDPETANFLASEATIITGAVNAPLERLGYTSIMNHLGIRRKSQGEFAKRFAKSRFNIFAKNAAKEGGEIINKDTMLWQILKTPRTAILEGLTEGYQEGWSYAVQEAIRQGYGQDETTAMGSLFSEASKVIGSDITNYALPYISDIDRIRESAFAGSLGGGMMASLGISAKPNNQDFRWSNYRQKKKWKARVSKNNDSVTTYDENGKVRDVIVTEEGQGENTAQIISENTGISVEYSEQTPESFAIAVARLIPGLNGILGDGPLFKDILKSKVASNKDLNATEQIMQKAINSKADEDPEALVLTLVKHLVNDLGVNVESFINGLNLDDGLKSVLLWHIQDAFKNKGRSLISKQIKNLSGRLQDSHLDNFNTKFDEKSIDEKALNMLDKNKEDQYIQHIANEANIPASILGDDVPLDVIEGGQVSEGAMLEEESKARATMIDAARKSLEGKSLNNLTNPGDVLSKAIVDVAAGFINIAPDMIEKVAALLHVDSNMEAIAAKIEEFVLPPEQRSITADAIEGETPADIPSDIKAVANIHASKVRGNLNTAREAEVKYLFKQLRDMDTLLQGMPTTESWKGRADILPGAVKGFEADTIKYNDLLDTAEVLYFQEKYGDANAKIEQAISMIHERAENEYAGFSISESGEINYLEEEYVKEFIQEKVAKEQAEIGGDPLAPIADPGAVLEREAEIPDDIFDQMMQDETGMSQADINQSIKAQTKKAKTDNKVIDNKKQSDKAADDIVDTLCIKPKDLGEF